MIDAQAPGVAGVLRGLSEVPASGEGWPGRLLAAYAQLHLLARAHQRIAALPPELAATVRSRIGYPTSRADVLTQPAVTDHWAVLGVRDLLDGNVPGRRVWLRGRHTGRWAMLLTFAAPGGAGGYGAAGWQDPDTARLRPGTELHASLHYYPGQPALRAAAGERHAQPVAVQRPVPAGDVDALLASCAAGLEQDPWLTVSAGPAHGDAGAARSRGRPMAPGRPDGRRAATGGRAGALDAAGRFRRASGHGGRRVAPGRPAAAHGLAPRPGGSPVNRLDIGS